MLNPEEGLSSIGRTYQRGSPTSWTGRHGIPQPSASGTSVPRRPSHPASDIASRFHLHSANQQQLLVRRCRQDNDTFGRQAISIAGRWSGVLCSIEYRVSSIKTRVSSFNWISRKPRIRPFLILEPNSSF